MQAIRPNLVAIAMLWLLTATGCHRLPASWYYTWNGYPEEPFETPYDRVQKYRQLAETAAEKSPQEREQIAQGLSQAFADEPDPIVRAQIVRTLGAYPTASATAALQRALADEHEHVRGAACFAWGRRGGEEAVMSLSTVLRTEKNADVRLAAVRALGEIGDAKAVPGLAVALEDTNVAVQHRAMTSLEGVTGRYYGKDVNAWRAFAQGQDVPPKTHSIAERVHEYIYR